MTGRIEVICGPMFSGKTRELILRVERAQRANRGVQVFVPARDDRHGVGRVVSHARQDLESTGVAAAVVQDATGLARRVRAKVHVVAIDEAQFFEDRLLDEVYALATEGRRVIVAGLDMDYRGRPFGPMPQLMAMAHDVAKLPAVCVACGEDARYTYRKVPGAFQVEVGAAERYEARCLGCYLTGVAAVSFSEE